MISPELRKMIADGVAEAMKPMIAALHAREQQQQQQPTAPPLTMADLAKTLDTLDRERAATAARDAFQRERLADLPDAYRQQLGSDPARFGDDERRIRQGYRDDLGAAGFTPPAAGPAAAPAGRPPGPSTCPR